MKRETFQLELVTPCFLRGAAESDPSAEWRATSIRGQLRWWFRAVAGGVYAGGLGKVRAAEERIFGSTARGSLLRVRTLEAPKPKNGEEQSFGEGRSAAEIAEMWGDPGAADRLRLQGVDRSKPLHYLGYGPVDKSKVKRQYLPARGKVSVDLQWQREPGEELKVLFDRALWGWINLGGIGARSRKGFGSLRLLETTSNSFPPAPATREELLDQARRMLPLEYPGEELPEWTHFSRHSRIYAGVETFSWGMDAMERLGAWLIGFRRRYGSAKDTSRNLTNRDYEWAAPNGRKNLQKQGFPDRAGFGLPLPFKKKIKRPNGTEEEKGENVTWGSPDGDTRRASPLLLHVARVGEDFVPVLTYLPARFLPEGGLLYFQGDGGKASEPTPEQLGIVGRFLDDLASEEKKLIERVVAS